MTKMTCKTNLLVVTKVVELDITCINGHSHKVGPDKIFVVKVVLLSFESEFIHCVQFEHAYNNNYKMLRWIC